MNGGRIQELNVIVHALEKKSSGERERERIIGRYDSHTKVCRAGI